MRATLACVAVFAGLAGATAPVPKDPPLPAVTKEHLEASESNLKQIGIAFHNHADAYDSRLPINITDKKGKELLSWRVALLPFIEQQDLSAQFKLDEPWDSETNKKLIEKMPKLYAPIRVRAKPGETYYQVFSGASALFGPKQQPRIPRCFRDGTWQTALVVEAGESVIWTKPADLPFDEKGALPKLGGLFNGDFHAAAGDGSVILLKKDFDVQQMKYFIMPADGNEVDFTKLKK
jgi:hypothetical protein